MVEYSRSVVVDGVSATFDPPIEAIYVLTSTNGNTVTVTINGKSVVVDPYDLANGGGAASTPLVMLPGCTSISGTVDGLSYIALRDAGYPPKAPNDSIG
jgi:hypothetical protein